MNYLSKDLFSNSGEERLGLINIFYYVNFISEFTFDSSQKKSFEFVTSNRRFWLEFSYPVYKRISLSFSNGLLYITPKKKPIFGFHLRLFCDLYYCALYETHFFNYRSSCSSYIAMFLITCNIYNSFIVFLILLSTLNHFKICPASLGVRTAREIILYDFP